MKMSLDEFIDGLVSKIEEKGLYVEQKTKQKKNNDHERVGLCILTKEQKDAIDSGNGAQMLLPTVWVEQLYEDDVDIDDAANIVLNQYKVALKEDPMDFNINDVYDYNLMKDRLFLVLVNKDNNQNVMEDCPYIEFNDLIICVKIACKKDFNPNEGISSVKITNYLLDKWGKTKEEILLDAYNNTKAFNPYKIVNINEILKEIYPDELLDQGHPMWVCSGKRRIFGAIYLIYKDVLNEVAEQLNTTCICILPSSIHELIILDGNIVDITDEEAMLKLVQEVNSEVVLEEEILSDNVYFYDADKEELTDSNNNVIEFPFNQ